MELQGDTGSNNTINLTTANLTTDNLITASGATKRTWVYVVAGARPEAFRDDHNTEELGIVSFKPEGHAPKGEKGGESHEDVNKVSNPARLRQAGKGVNTKRPPRREVENKDKEETKGTISGYIRPVFTDARAETNNDSEAGTSRGKAGNDNRDQG